jgi:signal transduction histidine kinase
VPDYYHIPALVLTELLLPAFGYLFLRFRDTRSLLWFLGFFCSVMSMVLVHFEGPWSAATTAHPWTVAMSQVAIQVSTALFLASLSPARFRVGRVEILYVIPYALPAVVASVLAYGVFHGVTPKGPILLLIPALGAVSMYVALLWGAAAESNLPKWLGISYCALLGSAVLWVYFVAGDIWALVAVQCANLLMTALLLAFVFRRMTPGVVLSAMGFAAWSLTALQIFPAVGLRPVLTQDLIYVIVMGRVVAAVGMIMLTLEDELDLNQLARQRERRARHEMDAYTVPTLARRRVEDFDRQGDEICELVREHSRFRQAALLLENNGRFKLAGSAGFEDATVLALSELTLRISPAALPEPGSGPPAVDQSKTVKLDLAPWLGPGDDLKRLGFTTALAVPMRGRASTEGLLLLAGLRPMEFARSVAHNELRAEDLLPIEMLAARLQATRSQTIMFEKLIDSEKFSGLGQLAANVAHHLNNPLTVILGYASLLEETVAPGAPERKGVESILTESRRMRSTLESLARISRTQTDQLAAVSVGEMLADMGQLYRNDFLQRSIEFRMNIAPELPRVMCSSHQLRQAVLQCLQYSIAAVENHGANMETEQPRTIRLEATSEGQLVQIMVAHTGAAFASPERAFDPFTPGQVCGEAGGLGLSLCATIMRDHNGRASAMNLDPQGAAIVLELQTA